ncbi:MAG TPA: glycoside hydrolase family 43 protein [Lacunisphaera sp.]|jgi:arabinan endo-1,5-alpha-L-arabinosidase
MLARTFVIFILSFGLFAGRAVAADWPLTGALYAHDPSLIKEGTGWWCFTTGPGLRVKTSADGLGWTQAAPLFTDELPWWRNYAPKMRHLDVWAPDVQEYGGRTWCYYAVSEFGRNNSAIGLKSCSNLAAGDWRDDGFVIGSRAGKEAYNTIDPFLTTDAAGKPWLVFGSWFDGIQLVTVDPATMKPNGPIERIAWRENGIEAPNLVYANGWYYLFVSIDKCCQGVKSTYKIAFGRSAKITGPYVDEAGVPLLDGGGTLLEIGGERWKGPGGQDVFHNGDAWVLTRHSYDAQNNGRPTLRISDLFWGDAGWPTLQNPATPRPVSGG